MTLKKIALAAAMATAGVVASSAMAQSMADRGGYVGGAFGQSSADCEPSAGLSCDDKDTSWKVFGGYQINRNFAVELGYANLGEISISGGGVRATAESTAWDLVGLGIWPVNNQFSIYGKLGVYMATVDVSVSPSAAGESGDDSTTGLTFGAGVRYNFTRNLGLQAEWQRYGKVEAPSDTAITGDSDLDVLSVGIVYRF
jgi:OOP family OmpA-OmpF porin